MVVFGVIVTICAGLWGQFVEGSDKLKRPFGFYGAMLGIVIASLVMRWMGVEVWVMLGIFSVFMPWVQGIGRFRCLVNGCCHGAETGEQLGIRYTHPRSRVCFVSGLKGRPLHPTQLYSMLWLALVGGLQLKLWLGGAAPSLIFGTYLIMNGLGRFVEEAYRGEPQTPVMAGLRLYQWAAVVSVTAGIIISCVPAHLPALTPGITWQSLARAGFMWVFVQFMMGIDFPNSNRRFSRLA
jgi:prolipoprotein diacylglyceryltransferase